jgi:hypothetical protein
VLEALQSQKNGAENRDDSSLVDGCTDIRAELSWMRSTTRSRYHAAGVRHRPQRSLPLNVIVGRLIPAGTGMPQYRDIYMEKEEPAPAPTLEELLRPEDEEALSLADFEDEQ